MKVCPVCLTIQDICRRENASLDHIFNQKMNLSLKQWENGVPICESLSDGLNWASAVFSLEVWKRGGADTGCSGVNLGVWRECKATADIGPSAFVCDFHVPSYSLRTCVNLLTCPWPQEGLSEGGSSYIANCSSCSWKAVPKDGFQVGAIVGEFLISFVSVFT